jgi:hypothetical protein
MKNYLPAAFVVSVFLSLIFVLGHEFGRDRQQLATQQAQIDIFRTNVMMRDIIAPGNVPFGQRKPKAVMYGAAVPVILGTQCVGLTCATELQPDWYYGGVPASTPTNIFSMYPPLVNNESVGYCSVVTLAAFGLTSANQGGYDIYCWRGVNVIGTDGGYQFTSYDAGPSELQAGSIGLSIPGASAPITECWPDGGNGSHTLCTTVTTPIAANAREYASISRGPSPPLAPVDAGSPDAGVDSGIDSGTDSGIVDSGTGDGGTPVLTGTLSGFPLFQSANGGGSALPFIGNTLTGCSSAHVCGVLTTVTCPSDTEALITPPATAATSSASCSVTVTVGANTSTPLTNIVSVTPVSVGHGYYCGEGLSGTSITDFVTDQVVPEIVGYSAATLDNEWPNTDGATTSCSLAFSGIQGFQATFTAIPQPNSVFVIGDYLSVGGAGASVFFDSNDPFERELGYIFTDLNIYWYAGTATVGHGLSASVPVLMEFHFDGASSYLSFNDIQVATGNPGLENLHGISIGSDNAATSGEALIGHIALLLVDTNPSADHTDIHGYSMSQWGLP